MTKALARSALLRRALETGMQGFLQCGAPSDFAHERGDIVLHTAQAEVETEQTSAKTAEQQQNYADVPQWTLVIPEREVEAMQAVVKPTLDPACARDQRQQFAAFGVDVNPALRRIVELHAQRRQRQLAAARVIVVVVVLDQGDVGNRSIDIRIEL